MRWQKKSLIQKLVGIAPFGYTIHYELQRRFGGLRDVRDECISKIDDWHIMMKHLKSVGFSLEGKDIMEIGTGWYPLFPICLYLIGAKRVSTFDLNRYMKSDLTKICLDVIGERLDHIKHHCKKPRNVDQRYKKFSQIFVQTSDCYAASDKVIVYNAPYDATKTLFPNNSIDLVFSNTVLEHVSRDIIEKIINESMRILKAGAYMFHSVNCGDHYAYIDKSISQLNYLQYSDSAWNKWNNKFLYQNRMRAREFIDLAETNDFEILFHNAKPTKQRLKELKNLPRIDEQFKVFSDEEVCITSIDFLCKRPYIF